MKKSIALLIVLCLAFACFQPVLASDLEIDFYSSARKVRDVRSIWDDIDFFENSLINSGMSDVETVTPMYEFLSNHNDVSEIVIESDYAFSFKLRSGLWSVYDKTPVSDSDSFMTEEEIDNILSYVAENGENKKNHDYVDNTAIAAFNPYYGLDDGLGLENIECAEYFQSQIDDCSVDIYVSDGSYSGSEPCSVVNMKTWDNYGLVLFNGHGNAYSSTGKTYLWIENSIAGTYDDRDISEGHLMYTSSKVGVSGTYMEKYCNFDNTIIYLGACQTLTNNGTANALIRAGASCVIGYSDSVTNYYQAEMVETMCYHLARGRSVNEAIVRAKEVHGSVDPYYQQYWGGTCVIRARGNSNVKFGPHDEPVYHTVTLIDMLTNDVIATQQVEHGASVTFPEPPVHEVYEFDGWSSDGTDITADTEIFAMYSVAYYDFKLYLNDELYFFYQYKMGDPISVPEVEVPEGWTFSGWGYIPETMPPYDITLYATFVENIYTITYEIDGELFDVQGYNFGDIIVPPEVPDRDGYEFHWKGLPSVMPAEDLTVVGVYVKIGLEGDVNLDNAINTGDAVAILRHIAGLSTDADPVLMDLNHDGAVNAGDAVILLRRIAGLD